MQNRLIKHLSKGYKQRVGLAQAIIGHPDLIILDEPTVGLDPMQIIEIRDLIKDLSKNHAVILSSHILSEVSAICDKVMIINQGRLVVSDTPENLSKHIKGSNGVKLTVRGDKNTVHNALATIKEITNIEYRKEGDYLGLTVSADVKDDIREAIFYALADAKCPILAMSINKMSLEDIFLKVTKESNKPTKRNGQRSRIMNSLAKKTKEGK